MRPKVKYHVIYKHQAEYPVSVMCRFFGVSRSGYYAFVQRLGKPEKDTALAQLIAQQRELSCRTYGYRRMWLWLKHQNIFCNPKTVLQVMKKYDLLSEIRRRRKWQQMGNGHLLYPHQSGRTVPVYDPGPLRQQHRSLQNCNTANSQSGSGHHSPGHEV